MFLAKLTSDMFVPEVLVSELFLSAHLVTFFSEWMRNGITSTLKLKGFFPGDVALFDLLMRVPCKIWSCCRAPADRRLLLRRLSTGTSCSCEFRQEPWAQATLIRRLFSGRPSFGSSWSADHRYKPFAQATIDRLLLLRQLSTGASCTGDFRQAPLLRRPSTLAAQAKEKLRQYGIMLSTA